MESCLIGTQIFKSFNISIKENKNHIKSTSSLFYIMYGIKFMLRVFKKKSTLTEVFQFISEKQYF